MKKNYYLVPEMRLHNLKSGRIMAASLGEADTNNSNQKPGGVEDFEEVNAW
jgi:hypothetical protein